jgi:hypothetical protein
VTLTLQTRERHHGQEIADVKARGGWVESDVRHDAFAREHIAESFGGVVHHLAPLEVFE